MARSRTDGAPAGAGSTALATVPPPSLPAQVQAQPTRGALERDELAGRSIELRAETATAAVAAQAEATIKARYAMALHRPRDWTDMSARLLRECKRTSFARSAMYRLPRGGKTITGLSIRFAEAALRLCGNCDVKTTVVYDDAERRIVAVTVMDLETNAAFSLDVIVEKTVERRKIPAGEKAISQRVNSTGDVVYRLAATEDDLLVKQAALVSKAIRTCGLRLIPGDIQEEARRTIEETSRAGIEQDPDLERKRARDAWADLGIMPAALARWLGCDLSAASPAQLEELAGLYAGVRDGETTWDEIVSAKTAREPERGKVGPDLAGFKAGTPEPEPAASKTSAPARAAGNGQASGGTPARAAAPAPSTGNAPAPSSVALTAEDLAGVAAPARPSPADEADLALRKTMALRGYVATETWRPGSVEPKQLTTWADLSMIPDDPRAGDAEKSLAAAGWRPE